MTPEDYIDALDMKPHPEGGYYAEVWRDRAMGDAVRGTLSSIYYLLRAGERSHWHRVDAAEIWYYHAGSGLTLGIAEHDDTDPSWHLLGPDISLGARPQILIPKGYWQSADAGDRWCLVSCAVSPAFDFSGFELAPAGWAPGGGQG